MYFARHEWKQNPTSPKVYRVGAQVYRSIRTLFVYPGNCGIFAQRDALSQIVYRVRATSLSFNFLPNFPVPGIIAVVAASVISSPQDMVSRRRQPCAAPSIIATRCKPMDPTGKCVPAGAGTAAKQAERHQLNNTASIINILYSTCRRGSGCVAYAAGSPDACL
jgi:hypothetical protein